MKRQRPKRRVVYPPMQPIDQPWGICPECHTPVDRFESYMLHVRGEFFHSICWRLYVRKQDGRQPPESVICPDCGGETYLWFLHYYKYCHICMGTGVQNDCWIGGLHVSGLQKANHSQNGYRSH